MRNQAGYSLIELVIVLALLGLISVAIAGSLRFGSRVWERTEQEISATETARGGHALLGTLLSHLYPRAAAEGSDTAFDASADRMTFLTDASSAYGAGGVARITFSVKKQRGGVALLLSHQDEQGGASAEEDVLVAGADGVSFAYGEVKDGVITWSDAWTAKTSFPALIRVRVALPKGKGVWPDLIVRPRIDRAPNCIFDPVSFGCRNG
ncbi:MAG: type II secretion system protein J [Micropepsaceae bacterium]